jgi:hypothetical protein
LLYLAPRVIPAQAGIQEQVSDVNRTDTVPGFPLSRE